MILALEVAGFLALCIGWLILVGIVAYIATTDNRRRLARTCIDVLERMDPVTTTRKANQ